MVENNISRHFTNRIVMESLSHELRVTQLLSSDTIFLIYFKNKFIFRLLGLSPLTAHNYDVLRKQFIFYRINTYFNCNAVSINTIPGVDICGKSI